MGSGNLFYNRINLSLLEALYLILLTSTIIFVKFNNPVNFLSRMKKPFPSHATERDQANEHNKSVGNQALKLDSNKITGVVYFARNIRDLVRF